MPTVPAMVKATVDPISACIQPGLHTVPGPVQTRRAAITTMILRALGAAVEPLVQTLAPLVQPGVDAVAAVGGQGAAGGQGQHQYKGDLHFHRSPREGGGARGVPAGVETPGRRSG